MQTLEKDTLSEGREVIRMIGFSGTVEGFFVTPGADLNEFVIFDDSEWQNIPKKMNEKLASSTINTLVSKN